MNKVTRQCPQTTTTRERGAEAVSNQGPSAYQPNALPLSQTGSHGSLSVEGSIYLDIEREGWGRVVWEQERPRQRVGWGGVGGGGVGEGNNVNRTGPHQDVRDRYIGWQVYTS